MESTSEEFDPVRKLRPNLYWYLTFRCNLACAHCWVESSPRVDASEDLTAAEAMRVVQQIVELGVRTCNMTGGEVLIRQDTPDILESLAGNGVGVALETNGLLISDRFLEVAGRLQRRRSLELCISLDGGTPETHDLLRGSGTFRRTVGNLRRLAAAGVRFNLQCVLNRSNIETIPALYRLAAELSPSLTCLAFALLNPLGRGEGLVRDLGIGFADLDHILELVRDHRLGFAGETAVKAPPAAIPPRFLALAFQQRGVSTLVSCQFPLLGVLPNGDITICALSRRDPDLHYGNVRTTTLRRVWEEAQMDDLRDRYLGAAHLDGICGDCVWRPSCRGACRAWARETGGSFDAPYPLCAALAESGEFPRAYRLSAQKASLPPEAVAVWASAARGEALP